MAPDKSRVSKKKELTGRLDTTFRILYAAKENFEYCQYLYEPLLPEEQAYVRVDRNLQFIRFTLWQMTIIELDKLLSKTEPQRFNLFSLIENLKSTGHFRSFKVPDYLIELWEGSLLSHGDTISSINFLRNKIYAHTDNLKENFQSMTVALLSIRSLIQDLEHLVTFISESTVKIKYLFLESYFVRNDFDILKILANDHFKKINDPSGF